MRKIVIDALREVDPILAEKCAGVYRGFCPNKELFVRWHGGRDDGSGYN